MWDDIKRVDDVDGHVAKFVFSQNDAVAEAVLYRYPDYRTRTVICCSTQSGCPVGCRFCGAGDNFVRNLTADEIVDQVVHLLDQIDCDPDEIGRLQVMFMSMGEPLLNLANLVPALRRLYELFPKAALLISTSAPLVKDGALFDISEEIPTIGLQYSIHESTNSARDALIPFAVKLSLETISLHGRVWKDRTGRKPFINYCAHDGNSTDADADRLRNFFDPSVFEATVSVVCERNEGLPASNEYQRSLATDFASKLVERGFNVRVFDPAGQDTIGGGCGQLWLVQQWMREHQDHVRPSVGRGKETRHTPTLRPREL